MRTELYSVRSDNDEVAYINNNLKGIATAINEKSGIKILFKTEIDCNAKKIKTDLYESFEASNPPEFHIFANALDSKDISSFYALFSPFIDSLEKDLRKQYEKKNINILSYPQIKIHPITNLGEYPAYCFSFKRRKFLVLPRISLVGENLIDYISKAVITAKQIFIDTFDQCPDGYVYINEKPASTKDKLLSILKISKSTRNKVADDTLKSSESVTDSSPDTTYAPEVSVVLETNTAKAAAENSHIDNPNNTESQKHKKGKSKDKVSDSKVDNTDDTVQPALIGDIVEEASIQPNKKKKSRIKGFVKSFIPTKGDSKKSIILKLVVLVAIITFLTGAFLLLKFYVIDPGINEANMQEIQDIFYTEPGTVIEEYTDASGEVHTRVTTTTPDSKAHNWEGVQKINNEIVGWVKLNDTEIDYPVLYHEGDNDKSQYYLYRNYKKKYSDFGSIFLDYRCPEVADSKHVILHGHNMGSDKDAMFGSLTRFTIKDGRTQANLDYYKSHAVINFDTPKENGEWIVFAVMKIDVSNSKKDIFNYLQTEFENEAQYMNFIYNIKERSYFDINIPINESDRIITLSTCSYETDTMRTVVVARKLRDGEDASQYIKKAKAQTPASKVSTDFISEFDDIKWYDGDGKPKGDGTLEFMEQAEMFTVKFYDADGKVIKTEQVLKGEDAVGIVGAKPEKEQDSTYYYRFKKWDTSYKNVQKDLHVKPVYEKFKLPDSTENPASVPKTTAAPVVAPTVPVQTTVPASTPAPTTAPTQAPTVAPTEAPTSVPTEVLPTEPTQ